MDDLKEEKSDIVADDIDASTSVKDSIELKTPPFSGSSGTQLTGKTVAMKATPAVQTSLDTATKGLPLLHGLALGGMAVGLLACFWPGAPFGDYIRIVCSLVSACLLYIFFWTVRTKLKISELSPAKAALSVLLPAATIQMVYGLSAFISLSYSLVAPMALIIPFCIDIGILSVALIAFSIYWQFKWTRLIGKRFSAIERVAPAGRTELFMTGLLVNLGFFFPTFWYFLALSIYANSAKKVFLEWDQLDSARRRSLIVSNKKPVKIDKDRMLLRYQSSAGMEQWLKERFAEKSWKKAMFVVAIVAAFFFGGGPLLMIQALPALFAAGSAVGGTTATTAAAASATTAATASIVSAVVNWILIPLFVLFAVHILRTPTHLELTPEGLRFLWRYPLFRRNGRRISWSSIDDVSIKRPFGKTLPQDSSLCLSGHGQDLLNAKLKFIPSVDDKATLLEALDKWTLRSSARASDVTELLSPPADHSYTELWLQALTAPPKRERLKPLQPESVLKDETYQVNCQIGAGGQGFAYLATNVKNHEKVVLKEYLLPIFVDMESRRRAITAFETEARTLQSLQSEQIVKLEDFFIEDHRAYLVLEHIDGESLKQLVERIGPLKEHNVLQLAAQMCEILHYLHNLTPPLVHRDFTPDNLILRPDGKLKLIDFNVAQKMENESTFTGTIVGKQSYLPPEQFRGAACPASDIYAFGCSLFYLLVGTDPEPITVSHPSKERTDVPKELDDIVARATALEAEDRYATIDEVASLIHKLLQARS